MPIQIRIDDRLLRAAQRLGKHRTKSEAVNAALREYVRRQAQLAAIEAFGTFAFDPLWDYRRDRGAQRSRANVANASATSGSQ